MRNNRVPVAVGLENLQDRKKKIEATVLLL